MQSDPLSIGAFAEAAGVNVETIRFYQRKGLLPEPQKPQGCIRRYGKADVARVRFFKSAQRLGFSLDEVDGILMLDEGAHCNRARLLAEHKLVDVRSKLADLLRIESVLSALVDDCCAGRSKVSCPLIAALHDPPLGTRSDGPRRVRWTRACVGSQLGKLAGSRVPKFKGRHPRALTAQLRPGASRARDIVLPGASSL